MRKIISLVALILVGASVGMAQQKMYEPNRGSAERKALMDAIRDYDIGRNHDLDDEIFKVATLKVQGNWAFTVVERTNLPEAGEGTSMAILRKSGTGWKVMWSNDNDNDEAGVDAVRRLRRRYKDFYKELADYAVNGWLAG